MKIKCMLNDPQHLISVKIPQLSIFTLQDESPEESLLHRKDIIAHKTCLSGVSLLYSHLMALLSYIGLSYYLILCLHKVVEVGN